MVNYPHNLIRQKAPSVPKQSKQNKVDFANRGMSFEAAINATNDYYLSRQIAVIHKKPTPIQIVKVDYLNAVVRKSLKRTLDKLQRQIILGFTRGIILILRPRKPDKKQPCL